MQDVRVRWMERIERNYNIDPIPVSTKEGENFSGKLEHYHVLHPFFRERNAVRALFSLVFIMFITMLGLGVYYIILGLNIF